MTDRPKKKQHEKANYDNRFEMGRRSFLASAAAAGAGMVFGIGSSSAASSAEQLNCAIIGTGSQGMVLLRDALRIPGIRFRAVCDIWEYSQRYGSNVIRSSKQDMPNVYVDYREMLASESDLDAVLIATPDWMHAEHTVACLEAGLHVYCEKEMSNTLEGARRVARAAAASDRLVQIGHQRRSNPFYQHGLQLIEKDRAVGRICTCYGQWHRAAQGKAQVPDRLKIPKEILEEYGYGTMERFRNWRWYRRYSGGPIADLGSHQIDIFNWFLHSPPSSVVASGGLDYYEDNREWYDNVLTIYVYQTEEGPVRAHYQVLTTSSFGGYFETFMGDRGTINISEDLSKCFYVPEPTKEAPEWVDKADRVEKQGASAIALIGESRKEGEEEKAALKPELKKPIHQFHLENFFSAIREGTELTCPPEVGYETAVSVLNANKAVEQASPVEFETGDFEI